MQLECTGDGTRRRVVFVPKGPAPDTARAQAGFEDDRVMLQGFYWESYRHGRPQKFSGFGDKRWHRIIAELAPAMREARFDLNRDSGPASIFQQIDDLDGRSATGAAERSLTAGPVFTGFATQRPFGCA